jgi:hypothetical protein
MSLWRKYDSYLVARVVSRKCLWSINSCVGEETMNEIPEKQLVESIARDLVSQFAPQELPTFSVISEAYYNNPEKMRKGLSGKEEILGLDIVGTTSLILTPIILAIVDAIIKSLSEEIAESSFLKRLLVKLHLAKKEEKKVTVPFSFTPAQLRKVRDTAATQAIQFKLPRKQAELLADSLIGKLSLIES